MAIRLLLKSKDYQAGFKAGYEKGTYDGGEHDCRMFKPTLESAWTWHVFRMTGLPVQEQGDYKLEGA